MNPARWHLLGAPWDCSGTGRGEQAAPAALRAAGLSALVHRDLGDAATVIDSTVRDTGTGVRALVELGGTAPLVSRSDVVLLGHRTVGLDDEAQAELARLPRSLRRMDAATVARDPAAAGKRAITWLADAGRAVWLHVDLDVLDPGSLAAVSYPEPGGLDWGQLAALLIPLARLPHLVGVSVADFRPDLDPAGTSAQRVLDLLERTLP